MKNHSIFKVIAFVFSMVFIFSCNKDEISLSSSSPSSIVSNQFKSSKILEFKDIKEYISKFDAITKMDKKELDAWEKGIDFISLRNIYEEVVTTELSIFDEEEKMVIQNPKLKETIKHKFSKLYEDNKESIYFQEGGFEMNAPTSAHASLINKNRVVKIGGIIHQFSKDKIKVIKNGDEKLIPTLDRYDKDGDYGNIVVNSILSESKTFASKNYRVKSGEIPCYDDEGNYRLNGYLTYARTLLWTTGWDPVTHFYTVLTSKHERQHWLWGWINHNTTSYSANGGFNQSGYNTAFTDLYNGGYINFDGYFSINEEHFAGHTSYAQRYFLSAWTEGHQYYFPHSVSNVNINMQFLDCNCTIQ
jgi:hypothetical protein